MQVRHAQLLLEMLVRLELHHCGLEFLGWDAVMEQDIELVIRPVLELRQAKVAPHDAE
jgi:hypothetical protein